MMKLEEYIEKRKKEDGLNEFDKNKKDENMKICVNYIFEYFNNYLNITELEEITIARVNYFYETPEIWGSKHKKKNNESYRGYEYDYKNGDNLFNIDSLYRNMPKKPFTKGKKREFEILFMYFWLHEMEGNDEDWDEYLNKINK